jgi:hypothetical protein
MITSKQIIKLSEDYVGAETFRYPGGNGNSVYLSVWKNPTSSDINKLKIEGKKFTGRMPDSIRFVADAKTKDVYVADGFWSVHSMITRIAKIPHDRSNPSTIEGNAELQGGKPIIKPIYDPHEPPDMREKRIKFKWDWLNNYFDTSRVKELLNI